MTKRISPARLAAHYAASDAELARRAERFAAKPVAVEAPAAAPANTEELAARFAAYFAKNAN